MKRAWLPLILALIGTVGSAMADEAADDRPQPVDLARHYVDAFLAGDMQTLLDHAAPALKKLMKNAAAARVVRDQSVGDGAQSAGEEISVTYNRRVKSASGQAIAIMAEVAPDGQLVAFSVEPAGEAPSKSPKYQTNEADERPQPVDLARRYVDAFLAGDMQPLLDHAAPALKTVMKDVATIAALRDQSVGKGAQSAGEEISVTLNRRVKSAGGDAFAIMAMVAPDGQLVAFSIRPAGADQQPKPDASASLDQDSDKPAIDAKYRHRLVGRYQLNPTFIFDVRDVDGHLMVGITNQATQEVFPDSPTRWSYRGVKATLEFQLPKTGRANSLVLHQNGIEQTARRIK